MLNIMLVDDEGLVRTGLRCGIDWASAGMQVVDEAGSVPQARTKLSARHDVDLIFTDIVMPGETGLDLIRHLKAERNDLPVVIMTYHDDFSYVQEALRLGAIDYIHKSEIEQDSFYATLRRIGETVARRKESGGAADGSYIQALMLVNAPGYRPPEALKCECRSLGHDAWLLLFDWETSEETRVEIENGLPGHAPLLFFSDVRQARVPDIVYAGEAFMNRDYFYRALPNLRIYEPEWPGGGESMLNSKTFRWLEEQLYSLDWLGDNALYLKILSTIQRLRLPGNTVANLFFGVRVKWQHLLENNAESAPFQRYEFWYQWVDWIAGLRRTLAVQSGCSRYSPEILRAMQRVMVFLDGHFTEDISVSQAAALVSLSESYFAKCFRAITRKSFHNYLRDMRLNYACKLLVSSHLSVARIAALSGFSDPLHFTKMFKAQYGVTPGGYRLDHAGQENLP